MPDTPIQAEPATQGQRIAPEQVPGWGADLDPAHRPAHPKERHPPRLPAHAQREPGAQPASVEVLHSLERPGLTPVFGSSLPPRGLSGRLRRLAFGFSENDLRHWLILLLADRVDMVEGLGEDLARGHLPNLWAEMGLGAQWRHNRPALWRRLGTAALVGAAAWVAWQGLRRQAPRLRLPPPDAGA